MNVKIIEHKHANIYLIGSGGGYILFDCGWQDSFAPIRAAIKGWGISFEQVRGVFVSHFHPDHAGAAEALRRHGVTPLILERQVPFIPWLNDFFKQQKNDPHGDYLPLDEGAVMPITPCEARSVLTSCGLDGEVIYTPGHSADSISLVIGDAVFTGDLPPYDVAEAYGDADVMASWAKIMARGVKMAHPAHGPKYSL